ncbi:FAD/NAD(P)-binding domain-containing protein [Cylindrobasidium torrendii FP15055 ss-10]|uniref:FAD/NAD(P)-binding domain-containing protein n=1 Tax=Cylindrobasidium torrendii FP15055 ss-10 TaxID=1314674 RepID=A0A0D7BJX0_9AGAR|nr:FAD/NAD(P)-binding domain-containing protein [Cylindrobasidium torrendii FP15055 ss-10]
MPRFRVAVCGAGIGGLLAAVALSKHEDIELDLYEGASRLAEVGAGVGMFPRPWRILEQLGLDEDLLKTTVRPGKGPVPSFTYRKADAVVEGTEVYTLVMQGGVTPLHRADFQNTLLRHLPSHYRLHTSKRLKFYTQDKDGVTLTFEDGSTAICDVLLAADGMKSAARAQFLHDLASNAPEAATAESLLSCVPPVWTGITAYRALIPADKLRRCAPHHPALTRQMHYFGKDGVLVAYPIMNGEVVNFAAFTARHDLEGTPYESAWFEQVGVSEFASVFANWETDIQTLIQCVEKPLRWAIHTVKPLGTFVSGRVALLGDAAHAMHPNQGAGAGQAVEDAYMLATILGHPSTHKGNLEKALSVYDAVRRPFSQHVARMSRFAAQIGTLNWPEGLPNNLDELEGDEWLRVIRKVPETAAANWEWAWLTTIDDDVERALHMLESW